MGNIAFVANERVSLPASIPREQKNVNNLKLAITLPPEQLLGSLLHLYLIHR